MKIAVHYDGSFMNCMAILAVVAPMVGDGDNLKECAADFFEYFPYYLNTIEDKMLSDYGFDLSHPERCKSAIGQLRRLADNLENYLREHRNA